ncbi:MAG: cell division/cell wall cluster transcriptional repressor MraZ [Treponema sp.]|nr:cell division/cell wall cluster transcriptional repressor MraZ [Treponema sp.]
MAGAELTGEYAGKIDDIGRLSIPRQLREVVEGSELILLRGDESCLWLFPKEQWRLQKDQALSKNQSLLVRRRWNAQQTVELDKQGRIPIPLSLREYGKFSETRDCIIVGQDYFVEIWAKDRYDGYFQATGDDFKAVVEEQVFSPSGKDLGDGAGGPCSGSVGPGLGVSGAEGRG